MIGEGGVKHDHRQLDSQFNQGIIIIVVAAIRLCSDLKHQVYIFDQEVYVLDTVGNHYESCYYCAYYL